MGNIIITGVTSFIGKQMIDRLIKTNNEIYGLVRKDSTNLKNIEEYFKFSNFHIVFGNMDDAEFFEKLNTIDAIFLLAWKGTRGSARVDKTSQKESYLSTINFVKKLSKCNIKNIIGIGSQAEYGISDEEKRETSLKKPVSQYGIYKLKTYNFLYKFCRENNISLKWFRLFSCYGVGDYEKSLVSDSISKLLKNEPLDLSKCTQSWNFINIKDVADIVCLVYDKEIKSGAYNLSSNDTRMLVDFVYEMKGICNSTSVLNFGVKQKDEKLMNLLPNNEKLLRVIGKDYKFVPFCFGIKEIILKFSCVDKN